MRFKKSIAAIVIVMFAHTCYPKAKPTIHKCDKPVRIAIIDTGFGYQDRGHGANLCRYGHKDFSIDRQFTHNYDTRDLVPIDLNSHGTNVAGIIDGYAKKANIDYCLIIIKYYSGHQFARQNVEASIDAINYATNIHADYINYSSGGINPISLEKYVIEKYLNQGGTFVTIAGNNGQNLDLPQNTIYPGMYDKRIVVTGNLTMNGIRDSSSNYGDAVNRWEVGDDITAYGITMSGTSMSTAVATGKLVAQKSKTCDSR